MKKLFLTAIFAIFIFCGCDKTDKTATEKTDSIADNKTSLTGNTADKSGICELDFVKKELKATFSNEMITLKNVKCNANMLIYDFTYSDEFSTNLENSNSDQKAQASATMKNMLKAMYCDMPEFEPYRTNNLILHYNYSTKNIDKFYEVKIGLKDCK